MGRVDPGDDGIKRFIVQHYRFDPGRHERRNVVVAAFDDEQEMRAALNDLRAELEQRRDAGEPVDPRESVSGVVHEPGYLRRAANGHLFWRARRRGVSPERLRGLELPSNMSAE